MKTINRQNGKTSSTGASRGKLDIIAANSTYRTICEGFVSTLPSNLRKTIRVKDIKNWHKRDSGKLGPGRQEMGLFLYRLADVAMNRMAFPAMDKKQRHLVFVEDMPVEAIPNNMPRLKVSDLHRIHLAREQNPQSVSAIIKRAITGMTADQFANRIVDAWPEEDNVAVLSAAFDRLSIPFTALHKYLGTDEELIRSFEIDEDGSFLYWPHSDAHLGWEQLQGIVDPASQLLARQRNQEFNTRYGAAIRSLRKERGLKQSDISGITDRHLRRIENGRIAATKSSLEVLAQAHKMSLDEYLESLSNRL